MSLFSHSVLSDSSATPWTAAHQVPLSMGFSRQEYWSGLPFPSPGELPDTGIKTMSLAVASRFGTTESPGKFILFLYISTKFDQIAPNVPFPCSLSTFILSPLNIYIGKGDNLVKVNFYPSPKYPTNS